MRVRFGGGWFLAALGVLTVLSAPLPAPAQEEAAPSAEQFQADMEKAQQRFQVMVEAMVAYTRDVRLEEKDIRFLLDNWESLDAVGKEKQEEEDPAYHDGRYDFDVHAADAEFVQWCSEHNVEPGPFFRKMLRLQMFLMRDQLRTSLEGARQALPAQEVQMEEMRAQLGEETYKKMAVAFAAQKRMMERGATVLQKIPEPAPGEQEVLDRYADRLQELSREPDVMEAAEEP